VAYFSPSALRGKLRIGATEHISMTEICGVISTFTHHHPEVDIQLVVEQSHLLRQHFSEGSLEIILHQDFTGTASAEDKVLWSEKLYWYATPAWRHESGKSLKLITWGPECYYRNLAEEKLRQSKIPFAVMLECPSVAGMLAAITTGLGVGILNQYSVDKAICNVYELDKLMPLPLVDCMLRLNKHRYNPAGEAFCEMLTRLMHKQP